MLLDPNNMVRQIEERMIPAARQVLKREPNRIQVSRLTYLQLCHDAHAWFERKGKVSHLRKLFGCTVFQNDMIPKGSIVVDYDEQLPRR